MAGLAPHVGKPLHLKMEDMDYAFDHLGTSILTAAAASIRFDVPTDYKVFFLDIQTVMDTSGRTSSLRFNNDSGTNYDYQRHGGDGTTVLGVRSTGQSQLLLNGGVAWVAVGEAETISVVIAKQQTGNEAHTVALMAQFGYLNPDAVTMNANAGIWKNTTALINRIDMLPSSTGNLDVGTVVQLYGIKGEG